MTTLKRIVKTFVAALLGLLAHAIVRRYHPRIVMVTGSVGKTSTKDAVAAALSDRFFVGKSEKSYNSEIGVPLTIFGAKNPWGNPLGWLGVVKTALALALLPNHYPNLLVLEVGADRPGDLVRVLGIATPDVVVVTRLPEIPVHVEAYESPEAVREEEFSPAYALAPAAPLIVSADDPFAVAMAKRVPATLTTYGLAEGATLRVHDIGFHEAGGIVRGMQATVESGGERATVVVTGSVGRTQIYPAAAAIEAARAFGASLAEAIAALGTYEPPAGRGRLLSGLHGSTIIDDSYNSSPAAVEESLETLAAFPHAKRRVAVLGDMLELGRYSVEEHERIGGLVAEKADVLVAVGIRARAFARAAVAAGMPETSVYEFDSAIAAAPVLATHVLPGDVILVKGSQSVRTERIVETLLENGEDRARLVRQERAWQRR